MSADTHIDVRQDTGRSRRIVRTVDEPVPASVTSADQDALKRISWLIELGTWILTGLIGLRFLLKLMAANPANPFAQFVYFLTTPFLAVFVGLTETPSFQGFEIEFYDLIAIMVYLVLAWGLIRLLWILFGRTRS